MRPNFLKNKTIAIYDLEGDLIPTTIIYCISLKIIKNNETIQETKLYTYKYTSYSKGSLAEAIALINSCDYCCGHNIINFDTPVIQSLLNYKITSKPLDTLILSKIVYPQDTLYGIDIQLGLDSKLQGKYSLKAFGERLGFSKDSFEDFSKLSEEMGIYCNRDVEVTHKLLNNLQDNKYFPNENVTTIEHKAAQIIEEQSKMGFYLDITKARKLNTELLAEKNQILEKLIKVFKPKFLKDGPVLTYSKPSTVRKYIENKSYQNQW
jgi:hypothetical protein